MMQNNYRDDKLDFLIQSILTLNSAEECYHFLEDICTASELQEMSRRLMAARMLRADYVYREIAEQTGLSTATISRVNQCLKYGNGGYLTVLDRMDRKRRR